jgi:RNA polymerase sigma-70 factor (ECF subfamily)
MNATERRATEPSDTELVVAATDGDNRALDTLLRRHYDRIYAVCRKMTGNDADALDAAQDTCITIARRLDRFEGRSSFSTWAYRVATNTCLDELRRRSRRDTPHDDEHVTGSLERRADGPSLEDTVVQRLAIDVGLAELSSDRRAVVVLRDHLGLDYAEIAEVLDLPIGTVRSRLARGRAELADRLRSDGTDTLGNRSPSGNVEGGAP